MAKIGMRHPVAAKRTRVGGVASYSGGMVLAHAISANITVTSNSATLYGDDVKQDEESIVEGGTVSFNSTDINYKAQALLYGHKVNTTPDDANTIAEMTASAGDEAAEVGYGFYSRSKYYDEATGGLKPGYRAVWLLRVKFTEPNDENATMSNSPAYSTPTTTGNFFTEEDTMNWKEEAILKDAKAAEDWLDKKAGIIV